MAWSLVATGLALTFSVGERDDRLVAQRRSVDAVLAVLPDATIVSLHAPQPLVLSGRRNPTRHQMFANGLGDYIDDTWPGGLPGFQQQILALEARPDRHRDAGQPAVATGDAAGLHPGRPRAGLDLDARAPSARTAADTARARGRYCRADSGRGPVSGRRQTVALAGGAAVSGLMAYAVFAVTTRALGADAAAPVSVLWTWWGFAGAAFTFPLQHWVTRTVSAHGEGAVRVALPRVGLAVLAVSVVTGGLAWLARDALFHRSDAWFPLMVLLVTFGSSLIGLARGGPGSPGAVRRRRRQPGRREPRAPGRR